MSKFRWTTILRPFFDIFERLPKTQNFFFEKLPPCTAKTIFSEPKGHPFGLKKYFFSNRPKSIFYQSQCFPFGLTIPKWYNTWVLKIYLEKFWKFFWKKIQKNIFEKNIYKKYLQYPSVIPFWNRENKCHNMALIKTWFEEFFFSTSKGGTLWIFKNGFCSAGG